MSLSHNQTFNYKSVFFAGSKKKLTIAQCKAMIQGGFQSFFGTSAEVWPVKFGGLVKQQHSVFQESPLKKLFS